MHALTFHALGPAQEPEQRPLTIAVAELDSIDRWTVYRRLQDLGLTCRYGRDSGTDTRSESVPERDANRPLTVTIRTPIDALLVWSVVHTVTQPKHSLADHLERCWQQRSLA